MINKIHITNNNHKNKVKILLLKNKLNRISLMI